jgi:ribosomal protein L19
VSKERRKGSSLSEGVVIRKKKGGIRSTFTVRKISTELEWKGFSSPFSPVDRIDVLGRGK